MHFLRLQKQNKNFYILLFFRLSQDIVRTSTTTYYPTIFAKVKINYIDLVILYTFDSFTGRQICETNKMHFLSTAFLSFGAFIKKLNLFKAEIEFLLAL